MTNYVCRYPDGAPGLGLLLLRVCQALAAFGMVETSPAVPQGTYAFYIAAALAALFLVLGLAARWVSLLLAAAFALALPAAGLAHQLLLAGHVGGCVAITLLGAGAYSVDARRHGRLVIHLQPNTPDRGSDD